MLTLKKYPRSPNWYVRGTVAGQTIFESTRTRDKAQAEAYRVRLEHDIYECGALGKEQPATFAEAAIAYMEHTGQARFITPLIDYFKERQIDRISQGDVDQCAREISGHNKPSTRVRHIYGPMSAILNHAYKITLPGSSPRKFVRPKIERQPVVWATDDYLDRLLPHCHPRLQALVIVMTDTGLRISEALRLIPADFSMRRGWINIGRMKNGEAAFVPISNAALAAVDSIMPDGIQPVFGTTWRQNVNQSLRIAAKRAGLAYLSTHKIGRHAFAARLLGEGYDIKMVKEAGRWKDLGIVDRNYGHLEQRKVHDAMRKVAENRAKSVNSRKAERKS